MEGWGEAGPHAVYADLGILEVVRSAVLVFIGQKRGFG